MNKILLSLMGTALTGVLLGAQPATPPAPARPAGTPPTTASPQQPTEQVPEKPTFRTGVELVTVDVTVLNSRGEPVTDLLAPEFNVTIDGKPRRVVSADYIKIDVEAAKKAAEEARFESHFTTNIGPPTGRLIVLAIDQGNVAMGAARPILASAAKFLKRLSPLDRVAFVALPPPGPIVDFTTDHEAVRLAMTRVVGQAQKIEGRFNVGMVEAIAISQRHDLILLKEVVQRECGGLGLSPDVLERCERDIEQQCNEMVSLSRERSSRSLAALRGLLADLTVVEGQKSLILMSEALQLEGLGGEIDDLVRLASLGRVSVNILLLESLRYDAANAYLSPTDHDDRALETSGLEMLAGESRGALFRVSGTGEGIFERLITEMSGHYLLGVEQDPGDRDGKRHKINVEVKRRNLTLRSRRAFVLPQDPGGAKNAEQTLAQALKAPFAIAELPVRVTTYAYQDGGAGKVRIVLAAEVGQQGAPAANYSLGFVVSDEENRVVLNGFERKQLVPSDNRGDAPLQYIAAAEIEPGTYTLRFGAVDVEGRRGTVLRTLNAWQMAGQDFAIGDLVVGNVSPDPAQKILPAVEPRVMDGLLGAYTELYSMQPASWANTVMTLEVAEDETSSVLATGVARLYESTRPELRQAQAVVDTRLLPPGRYIARARVTRDGKPAAALSRPFVVLPRDANAGADVSAAALPPALVTAPPPFDMATVLEPEVVTAILAVAEKATPAAKEILAMARAGKYAEAGLAAFDGGHQELAGLLRALDVLGKNQVERAAGMLNGAAGPRRQYFPAAFYLGACYSAAGRDRDAAGVWQLAVGAEPRPAIVYTLLADARLRDGHPEATVPLLQSANQHWPQDDGIARRLALAYTMSGKHGEALPVIDAYLARHPGDQDVLLAAVMSLYESGNGRALSPGDRTKLMKYASAYKGPQKALVSKYVSVMQKW